MAISLPICLFVVCFFVCIGVGNLNSKTPVTFYTGEKPLKPEQVKDIAGWNRKHGIAWIVYGLVVALGYGCMWLIGDSLWSLIPFVLSVLVPIPVMVICHENWKKTDLVK